MPSIDELIAAERRGMTPPPSARARNREAIAAALARPSPAHAPTPGRARPSWKLWLLPVLLLSVGAPWALLRPASAPLPIPDAMALAMADAGKVDAAPEPKPQPEPAALAVAAPQPQPPLAAPEQPAETDEAPTSARPPKTKAKAKAKASAPETSFDDELELLVTAKAAIDAGELGKARKALQRHRSRYPSGVFVDEARAMRVVLTCVSEKATASEREQARTQWRARHPNSPFAGRVDEACKAGGE